jgi:hypothetical protein
LFDPSLGLTPSGPAQALAYRKRFGDFQPDLRTLNLLCGLKMARMLSPAEIGEPETG